MSAPPKAARLVRAAFLLFVILLVSSACSIQTAALAPTSAPSVTPYPTATSYPTATPGPAWATYTLGVADGVRTYKIDMPGGLIKGAGSTPAGHTNMSFRPLLYNPPADHPVTDEMYFFIDASVVSDGDFPCRSGTPVPVDHTITGYQAYSTNDTCDGSPPPAARVFWITNGVCYRMTATTTYTGSEDFNTRYGAVWQHILASFVPPAAPQSGGTTCS